MYTQVYGITEFGSANVIEMQQMELKGVQTGYVRVKVLSTSVNPIDVKTRAGLGFVAAAKQARDFLGLGYDLYGEVVAASSEHQDKIGKYAVGMVGFPSAPGCYATYRDASADELVFIDSVKADLALGGLSLAGLTAMQALDKLAGFDTVYVLAPTGGVGHLAVQLGVLAGKQIIAVSTRPQHPELVALAEKHNVQVISYDDFFADKVFGSCIDLVGGEVGKKVLANFEAGSKIITVPTITKDMLVEFGASSGVEVEGVVVKADRTQLAQLVQWFDDDQLNVIVGHQFNLANIATAHQKMESGDYSGKLLIVA